MFRLYLFVIILCFGFLAQNGSDGFNAEQSFHDLQLHFETQIQRFKIELQRSFEQTRLQRKKQNNNYLVLKNDGLHERHLVVDALSEVTFPNEFIETWSAIEATNINEQTLLFWTQRFGLIAIAKFESTSKGGQVNLLARLDEPENGIPTKSLYFHYGPFIWFVVGWVKNVGQYLTVYQFDRATNLFHRRQTIKPELEFDFDIITSHNVVYLVVSNLKTKTKNGFSYHSTLELYKWKHNSFDSIAKHKTYASSSVKFFTIFNVLHVAVGQRIEPNFDETQKSNEYLIGSSIFAFNPNEEKLIKVQAIDMKSVNKINYYRIEGSNYLIFASRNEDARIFWWAGDQFLEKQTLSDTKDAHDISIKQLPNEEILFILTFKDRIKFFTESIDTYYKMGNQIIVKDKTFKSVSLFIHRSNLNSFPDYYALFTFNEMKISDLTTIWKLEFVQEEIKMPVDPLLVCLQNLEKKLEHREEFIKSYVNKAERVWIQHQNITQKITSKVIIKGKLLVDQLNVVNLVIEGKQNVTSPITNTQVKEHIDNLNLLSGNVNQTFNNVVYKSARQTIYGPIQFVHPISAFSSKIGQIHNQNFLVNKIPLNHLKDNFLTINGSQFITGQTTFLRNISAENIQFNNLINNINLKDIIVKNSPFQQQVNGIHKYKNVKIITDLKLNPIGTINKIKLNHFVTVDDVNQVINGHKTFESFECNGNINVKGLTNGRDLGLFVKNAVKLNGPPQVITGQITFATPITVNHMEINGRINHRVNITELVKNAVYITGDQTIIGKKSFLSSIIVKGNINVGGLVNGVNLDQVVTTNTEQVLTGEFVFKSDVHFKNNLIVNFINGINIRDEIIRRNSSQPQHLAGLKVFKNNITVFGDITMNVGSLIDGLDPSEAQHLALTHESTAFNTNIAFDDLIVLGNIHVPSIRGISFEEIRRTFWLKSFPQTITVPVNFKGLVKVKNLSVKQINGLAFPDDFVLKQSRFEVIKGNKTFVNPVIIKANLNLKEGKRVNGFDISFYDTNSIKLVHNKIQEIHGLKTFRSLRINGNIIFNKHSVGLVNGLDLVRDVMLTNRMQTINADVKFNSAVLNGLFENYGNINIGQTFNNVSLSKFASEIVYIQENTLLRPIRNKIFIGNLGVGRVVLKGKISGINITEMDNRVVKLNGGFQVIHGTTNFTGKVIYKSQLNCPLLNGLDIINHVTKVVHTNHNKHEIIQGVKIFAGQTVFQKNLVVKGLTAGVDLVSLQRNAMSTTHVNRIHVPITFATDITIKELFIQGNSSINGIRPADLVKINDNVRFDGLIVLKSGATVNGNINVKNLVNNCDLTKLYAEAIHKHANTPQTINGIKHFRNLEIIGNVIARSYLNNIDLKVFASQIVTKFDRQTIVKPVIFKDEIIVNKLYIRNLVNGNNFTFILNDVVLKNKPIQIHGTKIFKNSFVFEGPQINVRNHVTVNGFVNGIDVVRLNRESVKWNQVNIIHGMKTFVGPVIFKKNVNVHLINNIRIPDDYVLVNTSEEIPFKTVFKNVVLVKNIQVRGLIDGVKLNHFINNRVTLHQHEDIYAQINFTNHLKIDNLIVKKTINGIPVNYFVTKKGKHFIVGEKTFRNNFTVFGNLYSQHVINNVDLNDLRNRRVNLLTEERITGLLEFNGNVQMKHMTINGKLNGIDISDTANFFKTVTTKVTSEVSIVKGQIAFQEDQIKTIFVSHLNQYTTGLSYFELIKEIPFYGPRFGPIFAINITTFDGKTFGIFANENNQIQDSICGQITGHLIQPLNVYLYENSYLKHVQSIDLFGISSMARFDVSTENYFVASSHYLGKTFILQYRGFNMFELIQSFSTPKVEHIKVFWLNETLHLEVASPQFSITKILRGVINGPHLSKYNDIQNVINQNKH